MNKFVICTIIVISLLLPVFSGILLNNHLHNTIVDTKQIEAIHYASHIIHSLNQKSHEGHNHTKNNIIHLIHEEEDHLNLDNLLLHKEIQYTVSDLRIDMVRILDQNGSILFSSSGSDIGIIDDCWLFKEVKKTNKPTSTMIHIGIKSPDGDFVSHSTVETYVPIMIRHSNSKKIETIGYLEIYNNISDIENNLDSVIYISMTIMIGSFILIMLIIFYIFRQKKMNEEVYETRNIIETISRLQDEFIISNNELNTFSEILKNILKLTNCEFGFILEVSDGKITIPYALNGSKVQEFYNSMNKEKNPFKDIITTGKSIIINDHISWKEGHPDINSFAGIPIYDSNGLLIGIMGLANKVGEIDLIKFNKRIDYIIPTLSSIIELYQTKKKTDKIMKTLLESEEKFRLVTQSTHDAIIGIDDEGKIIFWNNGAEKIFGYRSEDIMNSSFTMLLPEEYISGYTQICTEAISVENSFFVVDEKDIELFGMRKDGDEFPIQATLTVWPFEEGKIYSVIIRDISTRKKIEQDLVKQANFDYLTDLPNRNLISDRLKQAKIVGDRNQTNVAILFVDLDRFKYVNDNFGHGAGDELLKQVAKRLKGCVREGDTIARIGGDEFLIILSDVKNLIAVREIAKKILKSLSDKFSITYSTKDENEKIIDNEQEVNISGSVGISIYPDDGFSKDELMKKSDAAMYQAKDAGKNNYKFYSKELDDDSSNRLLIERELRGALENNELFLVYQPIVCLSDNNKIVGVEALIRWKNKILGDIGPEIFIPIAENVGLMPRIGEWVFITACREMEEILPHDKNIVVNINVSMAQIENRNFQTLAKRMINEVGFPPELIQIEITESMIMKDVNKFIKIMSLLTDMGISIAIDDFGTGYSSLSYLKKIKANTLKIDKSFIDKIEDSAIIEAIIKMGQSLGIKIVAEGIETEEQLELLKKLKCERGQGYLFYKPVVATELQEILCL